MLDDLKLIHHRDGQDALGIAEKQYRQLELQFELESLSGPFRNVVVAGMGGSALAAQLLYAGLPPRLPVIICRGYNLPGFAGPETLFIASSYSGNTEETLSALAEAEERKAVIAAVTAGGRLAEIARQKRYVLADMPAGLQPRHATLAGFKALATILIKAGLADEEPVDRQLREAADFLRKAVEWWRPDVPTEHNHPKQIALELAGKSVVLYAGPQMSAAAYKWKISLNENAKNIAWWNQLPEFNHNEFIGWSSHPEQKPYTVINLRSGFEHERVQKRFELTERLLSGCMPAPINIEGQGENVLQQLLWHVAFGDFASIYLAVLNGLDPTPVDLIERFKKELGSQAVD